MSTPDSGIDFVRVINGVRLELESAGNPSYVVVVLDTAGTAHLSPMVYATVGPASDHAGRLMQDTEPGEHIVIVSRSAAGQRAMFTVLEPKTLKKLYQRLEVIEESLAESNRPL